MIDSDSGVTRTMLGGSGGRRWPGTSTQREFVREPQAGCRCAWSDFAAYGGWTRTTTEPNCPVHGRARPLKRQAATRARRT